MYKRKYKKGREIISFEGLLSYLRKDGFVYLEHKIYHQGWVQRLTLRYLSDLMDKGEIKRALKNK